MMLSIVIPMYNVAKYIQSCIDSVYNIGLNTLEFEIILIDDGSPDDSLLIAKKITSDKENVTIISQDNKGLGGARNTGIDNAKGEYIVFLDSDDILLPDGIKISLALAKKNNLDVLEFGAQGITEDDETVYKISKTSNTNILNGVDYYKKVRYMDSACNKLYRRDFLNKYNLRFLEKIFIEDYEFNTRVFYQAQRVMATPFLAASFLQTPNSITRNNSPEKKEKMKQDIIQVIKRIKEQRKEALPEKAFYFNQRLSYLTATLFYQLVKNKESYSEFVNLKKKMVSEEIFFTDYPILDRRKNLFRIFLLKNFYMFRLFTK
jgi:glycosyltransferase involved in cell wall biosynthesis